MTQIVEKMHRKGGRWLVTERERSRRHLTGSSVFSLHASPEAHHTALVHVDAEVVTEVIGFALTFGAKSFFSIITSVMCLP